MDLDGLNARGLNSTYANQMEELILCSIPWTAVGHTGTDVIGLAVLVLIRDMSTTPTPLPPPVPTMSISVRDYYGKI